MTGVGGEKKKGGKEDWGKEVKEEEERGGEGRVTAKEGGAAMFIATGNRPSYVH